MALFGAIILLASTLRIHVRLANEGGEFLEKEKEKEKP